MLNHHYEPRAIRFLELWEPEGWKIKTYGIAYQREKPRAELVTAAKAAAAKRLAEVPHSITIYRLGFLGIHDGRTANFVFIDWWAQENELHHHVYVSPRKAPASLTYLTPTGLTACVWDLRVMAFERHAWVEHVLKSADSPNYEDYLNARLSEDI